MTSIPASRNARAMIFAPRSCPSSPGFATTTRKGLFIVLISRRASSIDDRCAILTKYLPQHVANLADGGLGPDGAHHGRHHIGGAHGSFLPLFEGTSPLRGRPRAANGLSALDLTLGEARVEHEGFEGQRRLRID